MTKQEIAELKGMIKYFTAQMKASEKRGGSTTAYAERIERLKSQLSAAQNQ